MSDSLVSIVVPVFNSVEYLEECVASICDQDYRNYEIILVDDGSTDGSSDLCDRLATSNHLIRSVHQQNGGPSSARNKGVALSRGEFVQFVDADDLISPYYVSSMVDAARCTGADMVRIPFPSNYTMNGALPFEGKKPTKDSYEVFPAEDAARKLLYQTWEVGLVLGMVKREIALANPCSDAVFGEDMLATLEMVSDCELVALVPDGSLYAYRVVPDGLMGGLVTKRKVDSAIETTRGLWKKPHNCFPDLRRAFASRSFSALRAVFAQTQLPSSTAEKLFSEMKRYRKDIVSDECARRRERLAVLISFLGIIPFSYFCKLCRVLGLMR